MKREQTTFFESARIDVRSHTKKYNRIAPNSDLSKIEIVSYSLL